MSHPASPLPPPFGGRHPRREIGFLVALFVAAHRAYRSIPVQQGPAAADFRGRWRCRPACRRPPAPPRCPGRPGGSPAAWRAEPPASAPREAGRAAAAALPGAAPTAAGAVPAASPAEPGGGRADAPPPENAGIPPIPPWPPPRPPPGEVFRRGWRYRPAAPGLPCRAADRSTIRWPGAARTAYSGCPWWPQSRVGGGCGGRIPPAGRRL